ncbi:hypothetical protein NHX12_013799 [Muraenolepis orangiensis]|uniref:Insulin receptor substrate 2-B-like n=1 Tax=Muraenolepis orangiensis TaxID=630683 RepID=A0A9Q0DE98_9TELE|nr:hypothetical protein NHX12_013799 [Muraenolepis orangiensis]
MANFTNYQDGSAAMLMLEPGQQPRDVGANGDVSVGEPPSPVINISGGGGASRLHQQHLPPSNHHLGHHHSSPGQHKDQQQQHPLSNHHHFQPGQQQHLSGESTVESPGRKACSSVSAAEDSNVASGSGHVYAAVNVVAANTSDAVDDIRKCGYLRKQKHGHKRFFVLRAASHLGPSRLEYYDSEKKFRNSVRSAAAATASSGAVAPSPPKRVIYLYQCFTVNKRADSKNKHLIALYTKDEYFAIVAESEQEQEDWYVAVSELMSEGKKGHVDSDDLDDGYGTVTPGTVFKEVWQVNVKPKGLGQTKNLTGVYRLCLSTKTLHLVKLNSETPCVNLQLMNIRRCGHSESFFFIEVGRSSSIGPGEIWMQVDDSVVAQNMHETILETMKALKAFTEFRPRSKSQSSGSNPLPFITTRRHLGNLPPSQTGLQRRSRTESVVGTPPSSKSSGASGYRFRTSSEGEGTMNRPFRSATGSLVHLNTTRAHLGRHDLGGACGGAGVGVATGNAGTSTGSSSGRCYVRAISGVQQSSGCYHARSSSLPVSHFPSATSPVSVSSSSGHGSVSDTLTRPSSASICGSPSDGGFNSSDEYGSSPGDFRYLRVRSNTPDSLGNTPPIREEHLLNDYMTMGWHRDVFGAGPSDTARDESTSTADDERSSTCSSSSSLRRRTHSFSRAGGASGATGGSGVAVYQKMTQTTFSLDERDLGFTSGGLLRGGPPSSSSSSLRSDYSSCSEHSQQSRPSTNTGDLPPSSSSPSSSSTAKEDGGYMPMMCGVVAASPRGSGGSSSPVQTSPGPHGGAAPARRNDSIAERPENAEYMDMSCSGSSGANKPSGDVGDGYYAIATPEPPPKSYSPYFSLPRSYKAPTPREREAEVGEYGEYVPMSSPAKPSLSPALPTSTTTTPERRGGSVHTPSHPPPPYSAPHATRPNRLPLGRRSFHGPVRASETSTSSTTTASAGTSASDRPSSPGEYINIEFSQRCPPPLTPGSSFPLSAQEDTFSSGTGVLCCSPHQDYMSVEVGGGGGDLGKSQSPRPSLVAPWNPPSYIRPLAANTGVLASPGGPPRGGGHWKALGDDYTDMTFNLSRGEGPRASPTAVLQHLCVMEGHYGHPTPASSSPNPPSSPSRNGTEPKVVRADPQGRRRHSSETFTSPTSSSATPTTSSTTTAGPPSSPHAEGQNGSYQADGLPSRWSGSGSFDSVWMSVEGLGESATSRAHARTPDSGASSSGRMCRNMSSGYQNGLNYIALELREEVGAMVATTATTATTTTTTTAMADASVARSNGSRSPTETAPSENGGYTSIDFTKSTDAVASATKGE